MMKLPVALVLFTTSALADDLNPFTMRLRCESMRVSTKPDPDSDPVKWNDVAVDNFPGKPAEWIAVNHVRNSDLGCKAPLALLYHQAIRTRPSG